MKIIEQWGMIDKDIRNIIQEMKQVRNGLAHKWKESEVHYKGKMLKDIGQEKNDIDRLIEYLKEQQTPP